MQGLLQDTGADRLECGENGTPADPAREGHEAGDFGLQISRRAEVECEIAPPRDTPVQLRSGGARHQAHPAPATGMGRLF